MSKWLGLAVVAALASGCYSASAFQCSVDKPCGPNGLCEPGFNLCSFPDSACPSGRAFGGLAGDQSNHCVGEQPPPQIDATVVIDAAIDAPIPPDALVCYGTGIVKVCFASAPTQPMTFGDQTFDTGVPAACATTVTGGENYCVVVATAITINGVLRATGPKPLVLIASGTISFTGGSLLDASSQRLRTAGTPETGAGADADTTICVAGMPATNRGGGSGGSFAGTGGTGASGASANASTPGNAATLPVAVLRGGCPGQDGQATPGSGGHGGGAVYLIAGTRIDIGGNGINAGGEAGGGGATGASGGGGGGGGGAGGMIGLDAPMVMLTGAATLVANGGGGGEGGSGGGTTAGENGVDASTTGAARGGNKNTGSGGDGGSGSAGPAAGAGMAGAPGTNSGGTNGGGGGGGGGAGIITAPGTNLGGKASPATS